MSPSESDLRAALRAGEPDDSDAVNADHIIGAARSMRARRRTVVLSAAAAVVVVAGVAGGVAALTGRGSGSDNSSVTAQGATSALRGSGAAGGSSAPMASRRATVYGTKNPAAASCTPKLPQPVLPGGGSPGQSGASGPLLDRPVSSFAVCVYTISLQNGPGHVTHEKPQAVTIAGAAAQQLAASLENAATTPQSVACPLIRTTRQVTIVMTPIAADGTRLTPITAATSIPACNTQVTNGTAVRYNWQIPSRLQQALGVTVAGTRDVQNPIDLVPGQTVGTIGRVSGSPVK